MDRKTALGTLAASMIVASCITYNTNNKTLIIFAFAVMFNIGALVGYYEKQDKEK